MNESRGWKMFITFDTYESQKSKQMIRPQTTRSEFTYKHYNYICLYVWVGTYTGQDEQPCPICGKPV